MAQSDDELVLACRNGDQNAADMLVDRYWQIVHAYSYRLSSNATDAEDLAQETFLRAFSKLDGYKPGAQFKSWLLRITTNLYLDQKKASSSRDVVTGEIQAYAQSQMSPEQDAGQRELLSALQDAIQRLSKEQRIVVLLRVNEGMDYPEIAVILQTKETTARWHMFEARKALRQMLSQRFDLEAFADE